MNVTKKTWERVVNRVLFVMQLFVWTVIGMGSLLVMFVLYRVIVTDNNKIVLLCQLSLSNIGCSFK